MTTALVSFDLDETLLDDRGLPHAMRRVAERLAEVRAGLHPGEFLEANRRAWQEYWPEIERDWLLGTVPGEEITTEGWRRTLAGCGHPDEELIRVAAALYDEEAAAAVRLYPDVLPGLDALTAAGIALAVITNGATHLQRAKIRAAGIEERFDAVLISSEVGVAKPDPAMFRLALEEAGVRAEDAWHVGDNLSKDVAGAAAAGMRTAWLNRTGRRLPAGAPVPDVELPDLVGISAVLLHPSGPAFFAGSPLP